MSDKGGISSSKIVDPSNPLQKIYRLLLPGLRRSLAAFLQALLHSLSNFLPLMQRLYFLKITDQANAH